MTEGSSTLFLHHVTSHQKALICSRLRNQSDGTNGVLVIEAFQHRAALNVPYQGAGNSSLGHTATRWDMWDRLPEVNMNWIDIKTYERVAPGSPRCCPLGPVQTSKSAVQRNFWNNNPAESGNNISEGGARGSADPWQCPQLPLVAQNKRTWNILFIMTINRYRWSQ